MRVANIFLLLSTALILACYFEEIGPKKSSDSSGSDEPPLHNSSSSQEIAFQDPIIISGQSYKTIKMGSTIWFAENLNAEPKSGKSWCHGILPERCSLYGKLYDWEAAMDVCPDGWRLPNKAEFDSLATFSPDVLSSNAAWWNATFGGFKYEDYGDDEGGFSSLEQGYWWSSTEAGKNLAGYGYINGPGRKLEYNYMTKERAYSVRCVKK